jgi:acyl-CoA synthetase (AMP-forming)/AMP-acid ligase II
MYLRSMQFNLADLFELVVDTVPDRVALISDGRRLTFRELDDQANQVANTLLASGVKPGDHVGLYLFNSIEHMVVMIGAYKAQAVSVNVNFRYVADELAYLVDDADLVALFYDGELADEVTAALPSAPNLRFTVEVAGNASAPALVPGAEHLEGWMGGASTAREIPERSADDHYILYTGGTTGKPKGVVWRQEDIFFATMGGGNPGGMPIERPEDIAASVLAHPAQRVGPFLAPDAPPIDLFVSLSLGPLIHASGQWNALGAILGGGASVIIPDRPLGMERVLELIESERIVAITLVGDTSARPLLDTLAVASREYDTSSLLMIGSGGSILSGDSKAQLLEAFPSVLLVLDGVGSSEVPVHAVAVTTRATLESTPTPRSLAFAPRDNTTVLDEHLTPVVPGSGTIGRLATTGRRLPLEYYKDPVKTAATFIEVDGVRWTLPGDMATIEADGTIRFIGRGSMSINTGGEKVYPDEVEAALKLHPAVRDAAVVGVTDPQWGQAVTAVIALATDAAEPSLDELRTHCRTYLAGYKLPKAVVTVDAVVRSPAGKADYPWALAAAQAALAQH